MGIFSHFCDFTCPPPSSSRIAKRTTILTDTRNATADDGDDDDDEEEFLLWRLVTDHPNIFETHVATKLNGNDAKFFYDVNSESRRAMQRSGVRLADAFVIGDFETKSTLSWALEKCSERRERFCARMARNGNEDLLQHLHENGCPWDIWTCFEAAKNGHLECLKYAHENGCPWYEETCADAAYNGHLDCLKYAHQNGCPWDKYTGNAAIHNGHQECFKYAYANNCPGNRQYGFALRAWKSGFGKPKL